MTSRAYNALLGALTADAAGLGVHWLYGDNARVARSLGGVEPEFQEPDEARYAEMPSYYAHGGKKAGDLTHAGESALTVLRELVRQKRDGRELDEAAVGSALAAHFGPGGAYTGYVDSALRAACRNVEDRNALQGVAPERPVDGPLDEAGARMIARTKLPGLIRKFGVADEEQLRHAMEMAVRATHDFEEAVVYGNACVDAALELQKRPTGANDLQMSGIANLVPTVARFAERDDLANLVERVVRVTQNEDEPVAFAQAAAALLQRAITQPDFDVRAELEAGLKAAPENDLLRDVWSRALERAKEESDTEVVTGEFGRACYVKSGWPSIVHTLYHATSYVDGIRRCLLAGGDSVPRAAFVGAVLAARFGLGGEQGLPVSWLLRVSKAKEIEELASAATS